MHVELIDFSKQFHSQIHSGIENKDSNNGATALDQVLKQTNAQVKRRKLVCIDVSNACKYSQDEVLISVHREMDSLIMSFKDKGIGMSESDIEQIFYRFYRGENVGSIEGTGIGMSIMKRCLDALGGKVKINSELGKGSEFVVRLPVNQE